MATTANTPGTSSEILYACGTDHRNVQYLECPVFEIINGLKRKIEELLDIQQLFKFGEHGAMADSLYLLLVSTIERTTSSFEECEASLEKHPEWHLTGEVSRLRMYFDQVSTRCTEHGEPSTLHPSTIELTKTVNSDNHSLGHAKIQTLFCMVDCYSVIKEFAYSGAVPVSCTEDPKGYLSRVDKTFKRAVDALILPGDIDNKSLQAQMERSTAIWAESRRLLSDFKLQPRRAFSCECCGPQAS
ncbi:hypothetical protein DHEL01_v204564 [Diaporthe helianthi]|uniref:Uncharacterized protein n=1 Tax=Diaporthe helianthi TaxID=158607 RepID=A0A2P5I3H3_DIAHE|nr:hypothetical protein DHEL01_v204564 [Diaporthe helianthi]